MRINWDSRADNLIAIPELYVDYRFNDDVYAGYLTYSKQWKKLACNWVDGSRALNMPETCYLKSIILQRIPLQFLPQRLYHFFIKQERRPPIELFQKDQPAWFFQLIPL